MTNPIDDHDDRDTQALLVFLANGTLEGDEKTRVEAAVKADPQLQGELAALKAMRAEMQAQTPQATPGEFGLARLMRDIENEPNQTNVPATVTRLGFWKGAAAAVIALIAIQTAAVLYAPDQIIDLAGGGAEAAVEGPTLTVTFAETATEAEIRSLLLRLDLTIVSGPSALGIYTLAAQDVSASDRALQQLRAATNIVDSAEQEE